MAIPLPAVIQLAEVVLPNVVEEKNEADKRVVLCITRDIDKNDVLLLGEYGKVLSYVGMSFDGNSNPWIISLQPTINWKPISYLATGYYFYIAGSSFTTAAVTINQALGTGIVYSNGGTLQSTNPSDRTLKENINSLQNNLDIINQLRPVSYNWIDKKTHGDSLNFGFIAQEVNDILPNICNTYLVDAGNSYDFSGNLLPNAETKLGYDIVSLIPILVGALKEQQTEIKNMKDDIKQLKDMMAIFLNNSSV